MSTNFLQWNPTQANQETDSQWANDSERLGGSPNGTPFPSTTANKLFYQVTTGVTALMDMMAAKGFTVNDTSLGTLASVLAAIQTTADQKLPLLYVSYSPSLVLDGSKYSGWQISLSGNITSLEVSYATPGAIYLFIFSNDGAGNHTVTFPSNWIGGGWQPDPTPNVSTAILVGIDHSAGYYVPLGPMVSANGVVSTPIGQANPKPGGFTTLTGGATTLSSLTVNGNTTLNGNETATGTTSSFKFLASEGSGTSAGYSFIQDGSQDTGLFSPSDGNVSLYSNAVQTLNSTPTLLTALVSTLFNNTVTLNGGAINGTYGGNPDFTGTIATNVITTNNPSSTDSSTRVPNTAWVQGLFGALGFSVNLSSNGYIKFPTILGGLVLQWQTYYVGEGSQNAILTAPFPTTFPTDCLWSAIQSYAAGATDLGETPVFTVTGFTNAVVTFYWNRNADHGGNSPQALILSIGH